MFSRGQGPQGKPTKPTIEACIEKYGEEYMKRCIRPPGAKESSRLMSRKLGYPVAQTQKEIATLSKYARKVRKPRIIVEVGTRNGGSALVLAQNSIVPVVTIDILEDPRLTEEDNIRLGYKHPPALKKHWARFAGGKRIEQVTSPSAEWDGDPRPIGLLFLDGGHEYEEIRADWIHLVPMLEPGAYILLHDYEGFPGVTKFVDEDVSYPMLDRGDTVVVFQIPEE